MRKSIYILVLFIAQFTLLYSQNDFSREKFISYDYGKKFFVESHFLPHSSKDSLNVILLYRISNDLLSFTKTQGYATKKGVYYSVPNVEFEIRDEDGIIKKRLSIEDTIYVSDYQSTTSKTMYLTGKSELALGVGKYNVVARLHDNVVQNIRIIKQKDSVRTDYILNKGMASPLFAQSSSPEDRKLMPFILGNNVSFQSKFIRIIIPVGAISDFDKYNYNIKKVVSRQKTFINWKSDVELSGKVIPGKNATLSSPTEKYNTELNIISLNIANNSGLIDIQLANDKLLPGSYELSIVKDGSKDTSKFVFDVIWMNMPMSFQIPRYAVEAMYNVLPDLEYKELKKANFDEQSALILNYWTKNDPTPTTPFNEAMAEYFVRADYAFLNLQTVIETDGIVTDRGKVYILYGSPSTIERKLVDKSSIEIWRYIELKKEFTFESITTGVYKLAKIVE